MKRIFTVFLVLIFCSSWAILETSDRNSVITEKGFTKSNTSQGFVFELVTKTEFLAIRPRIVSCHIEQLSELNPEVDLKAIDGTYDFSSLKFIHKVDQTIGYILYNGEFLIVRPNNESK